MAARSPARSRAGPEVMCRATSQLGGDDARQRGLAEAGRAGEQQVVDRLPPPAGGLEDDAEVLLELALADEVVEVREGAGRPPRRSGRPRRAVGGGGHQVGQARLGVVGGRFRREELVACHQAAASFWRARRSISEVSASSGGSSRMASATSSGP